MAGGGERTWRRIEAPWAFRGHALVAYFGGEPYTAWELPDGSWGLSYGFMDSRHHQRVYATFTQARRAAERLRTRSPAADSAVAVNPSAPAYTEVEDHALREIRSRIPPGWLRGAPRRQGDGSVVVPVAVGVGRATAATLTRAFPFRVKVMEVW